MFMTVDQYYAELVGINEFMTDRKQIKENLEKNKRP